MPPKLGFKHARTIQKTCAMCYKPFFCTPQMTTKARFCGQLCKWKNKGRKRYASRRIYGKQWLSQGGYLQMSIRDRRKGVFVHRYVMEQHLGRPLIKGEVVHHINHDRTDNRIENLELTTPSEHMRKHHSQIARKEHVCRICGDEHAGLGLCQVHLSRAYWLSRGLSLPSLREEKVQTLINLVMEHSA